MTKPICAPMITQLTEFDRGKAAAYQELFSTRAAPDPGYPVTVVSVPGSAWDILTADRDIWKARAERHMARVRELEQHILACQLMHDGGMTEAEIVNKLLTVYVGPGIVAAPPNESEERKETR